VDHAFGDDVILRTIKEGDTVQCNVRGRIFQAVVKEKIQRGLRVEPFNSNITYYRVKSHQVERVITTQGKRDR
jgi:hypothetical protein